MSRDKQGGDFWSRRKAAVREAEEREEAEQLAAIEAEKNVELAEKTDEEILDALGLPDPDELGEGDDFKAFLTAAVPDRLRQRALRRLWTTNPALANLDGLIEYGEDYTDAATVVENLQTAYQVGKGMFKHLEKMAEDVQAEESGIEGDEDADIAESDGGERDPDRISAKADSAGAKENPNASTEIPYDERLNEKILTQSTESIQNAVGDCAPTDALVVETVPQMTEAEGATARPSRRMRFTFD